MVTIEIMDAEGRLRPVEVVLDTGFTGYLTLPPETIRQLGLTSVGQRTFELANGELYEFETYLAQVSWHARLTDAVVLRSDSEPLLGMALLWGSRVTLVLSHLWNSSYREATCSAVPCKPMQHLPNPTFDFTVD